MKFLVDAQLPPGLVYWLKEQGHSAEHVQHCGLSGAMDTEIWERALNTGMIIATKDEDFAERSSRHSRCPVILWLRIGNSTNQALFKWLEPRWPAIIRLLEDGDQLIEVR